MSARDVNSNEIISGDAIVKKRESVKYTQSFTQPFLQTAAYKSPVQQG